MQDEDFVVLEQAVSTGLSELSKAPYRPTEVDASAPFEPGEARFQDGSWLGRLVTVQDWLRLGSRLAADDDARSVLGALSSRTGDRGQPSTEDLVTGSGAPTLSALELLRDRVDRAVALKDAFLEDLDEGITAGAATTRWIAAWEEVEDEARTTGPVVAKASTWPIFEFAGRARRGRLDLSPSYQRGDVWPLKDAQMLMESILRGIPLPSVIILKPDSEEAPFEVVDGKQRLTSILRFMGAHPAALRRVKERDRQFPELGLADLFRRDYAAFRKEWAKTGETLTSALEKAYYFPFRLSTASDSALTGELAWLKGQYYFAIRDHKVQVGGESVEVGDVFEQVTDYLVPVIVYTKATRQQIHDVFNLYNKQGKHLNAEEIRNAIYHDLRFMRALTVAAGDNENLQEAADFLLPVRSETIALGKRLTEYGFGEARYKRTKVLSWLCSLLLVDAVVDGKPRLLSTAQQINAMLDRVAKDEDDPLRRSETIRDVVTLLHAAMGAHGKAAAWGPKFRDNGTGKRWQELQLVASLLGVSLATTVKGADVGSALQREAVELTRLSVAEWTRPPKTQTDKQWEYIARVALGVVDQLGVDRDELSRSLVDRFGYSCVAGLEAAAARAERL